MSSLRNLYEIAAPSVITLIAMSLGAIFQLSMAQGITELAVATVSIGQRLSMTCLGIVMGFGVACTALVSNSWGKRELTTAFLATRFSLIVSISISVIFAFLVCLLSSDISESFVGGKSVEFSSLYFICIAISLPFQVTLYILDSANRAYGDALTPLWINLSTNFLIVVGTFWVVGLNSLSPQEKIVGLGIVNLASSIVAAKTYLVFWAKGSLRIPNSKNSKNISKLDKKLYFRIAIPASLEPFILQITMTVFTWYVALLGVSELNAFGIGLNVFVIFVAVGNGFALAGATLVAKEIGCNNLERTQESASTTILVSMLLVSCTSFLVFGYRNYLAELLTTEAYTTELVSFFLLVLATLQPFLVLDLIMSGILRVCAQGRYTVQAIFISNFIIRLPLGYCILYFNLSFKFLMCVFLIDVAIKFTIIYRKYRRREWLYSLQTDQINVKE